MHFKTEGIPFSFLYWRKVARCLYPFVGFKILSKFQIPSSEFSSTKMSRTGEPRVSRQKPQLIVFDLDYTMWPYHVDSTVTLPFFKDKSKICDKYGLEIKPFPEAASVLEYLKSRGYLLAAASRTTKPPGAYQLLQFLDWDKYFDFKEIYPGCKVAHFERFAQLTSLPYESMLFFDDEDRNIREVSELGVKTVHVPNGNGISMELVLKGIKLLDDGRLQK